LRLSVDDEISHVISPVASQSGQYMEAIAKMLPELHDGFAVGGTLLNVSLSKNL
jgi:hypothetical protein